jgi:hypothetical protein
VVIFDENISFDHYFGTYPFAENLNGEPPFRARPGTPTVSGLYNQVGPSGPTGPLLTHNPNGARESGLWHYAQHFAMSDNNCGTTFGPSTPGALNVTAAQTYGAICGPSSAVINASTCTAPRGLSTSDPVKSNIKARAAEARRDRDDLQRRRPDIRHLLLPAQLGRR